jgi:hypothetical protein
MGGWEPPRRGGGRTRSVVAAVAAVVVVSTVAAVAIDRDRGDLQLIRRSDDRGASPTATASDDAAVVWTTPRAGLWRVLPSAPLTPRVAHAIVPAGDQVMVWGGFDVVGLPLTDGGLFDPEDGTWERLPAADVDEGAVARAVSAAGDLFVVSAAATHRFDVDRAAWTTLPGPPLRSGEALTDQVVGGHRRVITVAVARGTPGAGPRIAAFDVDTATWRRLPDPAVTFVPGDVVMTDGTRVVLATRAAGRRGTLVTLDLDDATPRWARLPLPTLLDDPRLVRIVGAVDGDRIVLTGIGPIAADGAAAVFDGTRWRDAAPPPLKLSRQVDGLWTGQGLLVWNRLTVTGAHLDPVSLTWEPLPPAPIARGAPRPAAWTGRDLVVWGGFDLAGALVRDPWRD